MREDRSRRIRKSNSMPCHTQNPSALDALRRDIDALDDDILALIERRVAIARRIARAKRPSPTAVLIRPDREEQVIDRLGDRSSLPRGSVATLWRELMALSLQSQRRTDIVVHAPADPAGTVARSAARFGAAAPIIATASAGAALTRARTGSAVAVIELCDRDPWWLALGRDEELAVIEEIKGPGGKPSALALARVSAAHLARARRWEVLPEAEMDARLRYGETLCPLARADGMMLCIVEDIATQLKGAA